jgi:hypothetical protein
MGEQVRGEPAQPPVSVSSPRGTQDLGTTPRCVTAIGPGGAMDTPQPDRRCTWTLLPRPLTSVRCGADGARPALRRHSPARSRSAALAGCWRRLRSLRSSPSPSPLAGTPSRRRSPRPTAGWSSGSPVRAAAAHPCSQRSRGHGKLGGHQDAGVVHLRLTADVQALPSPDRLLHRHQRDVLSGRPAVSRAQAAPAVRSRHPREAGTATRCTRCPTRCVTSKRDAAEESSSSP